MATETQLSNLRIHKFKTFAEKNAHLSEIGQYDIVLVEEALANEGSSGGSSGGGSSSGGITTETDPIFSASAAATITQAMINAWNNKGTSNLTIGTTADTAAAGNHNHDERYLKSLSRTGTISSAGWLRIAETVETTIESGLAIFRVKFKKSGVHSIITFLLTNSYNRSINIEILGSGIFNTDLLGISKLRVVYESSYAGDERAYLEIYAAQSCTNIEIDMFAYEEWRLIDPVAGSVPSGMLTKEVHIGALQNAKVKETIPVDADLNDFKESGFYYGQLGTNARLNMPDNITSSTFALFVALKTVSGLYTSLLLFYGISMYFRSCSNGTWTSWVKHNLGAEVYTKTEIDTMIGDIESLINAL